MPYPSLTLGRGRYLLVEGALCLDPAGEITLCSNTDAKTRQVPDRFLRLGYVLPERVLRLSLLSTTAQAISPLICSHLAPLPKAQRKTAIGK